MAHLLDRCGTLRPTDRDVHSQAAPFGTQTPAAYNNVALGLIYNGVSSRSLRHPSAADRDFHSAGGVLRHADARDVHRATAPFGSRTPAAGFAPPTRHARPLIFSPHATHRRLISSYKFLLSPPLFPVAAPIALRSARSAIVQRAPGRFAPHSFPLHGGETPTGLFFHLQVLPVLAASPAPLQASAPVALPRPPLGGRSPTTSAAQSPESRLCGGLSASIHPLHSPHRPCPKIIVLRSASL